MGVYCVLYGPVSRLFDILRFLTPWDWILVKWYEFYNCTDWHPLPACMCSSHPFPGVWNVSSHNHTYRHWFVILSSHVCVCSLKQADTGFSSQGLGFNPSNFTWNSHLTKWHQSRFLAEFPGWSVLYLGGPGFKSWTREQLLWVRFNPPGLVLA
jgi:hypothetical protein